MPPELHNDRTQRRLLPWIALIGFLGVALYALLPADFWLPEYKSAHHTVTPPEALTTDDFADDDYEDEPAAPPPTQPPAPPPKEIPGPPTSAKPPAKTADNGRFIKHYQTWRLSGDYWYHLQKSGFNPTLVAQLEPLQHRLEDGALTHIDLYYADYEKDGKIDPKNSKILYDIANIRYHQGRYKEAESMASRAVQTGGSNAMLKKSWSLISNSRNKLGDSQGAVQAATKAASY